MLDLNNDHISNTSYLTSYFSELSDMPLTINFCLQLTDKLKAINRLTVFDMHIHVGTPNLNCIIKLIAFYAFIGIRYRGVNPNVTAVLKTIASFY